MLGVAANSKVMSPYKSARLLDEMVLAAAPPEGRPPLDAEQQLVREAIGKVQWISMWRPDILTVQHRLSRVMAAPPMPAARQLIDGMAVFLMTTVNDGLTFGGDHLVYNDQLVGEYAKVAAYDLGTPAPKALSGSSDATWGHASGESIATCAFFYNHGLLHGSIRCIPSVQLNSNEAEKWAEAIAIHSESDQDGGDSD